MVSRQAHVIGNGVPNEYVQAMEEVRELDAFAAVVYSSHFELSVTRDANGTGVEPVAAVRAGGEVLGAKAVSGTGEEMPLEPRTGKGEEEEEGTGIIGKATGVFENVWGRVVRTAGSEA